MQSLIVSTTIVAEEVAVEKSLRAEKIARDKEYKARKQRRKSKKHQPVSVAGNKGNRRADWLFEAEEDEEYVELVNRQD